MPLKPSTSLIEPQESSSGGAFKIGCTTYWNLNRRIADEATGEPALFVGWGYQQPHAQLLHGLRIVRPQTELAEEDVRPLLLRVLCHFVVDQIPDTGLPELCESLRDFREYYAAPIGPEPLLPAPTAIEARFGSRYERPEFHIDEE